MAKVGFIPIVRGPCPPISAFSKLHPDKQPSLPLWMLSLEPYLPLTQSDLTPAGCLLSIRCSADLKHRLQGEKLRHREARTPAEVTQEAGGRVETQACVVWPCRPCCPHLAGLPFTQATVLLSWTQPHPLRLWLKKCATRNFLLYYSPQLRWLRKSHPFLIWQRRQWRVSDRI